MMQDVLQAVGPQSAHILDLWRFSLVLCTIVFALVLLAFLYALWRAPRTREPATPDITGYSHSEPKLQRRVTYAVIASAALLVVMLAASVWTDRALAQMALRDALHIRVTANQWWWQLTYDDADPSKVFDTANELHVPAGRPVVVTLKSTDVIHSLWLPNIAGKKDLIPGRTAQLVFRVDKPGVYRGQCAEFCGLQHAQMALVLVAEPPAQYEAWAAQQRTPAPAPSQALASHGQRVFLGSTCVMCHRIGGTEAGARAAPDLTHFGSRSTLAAGALPNTPQHLAGWISDPQKYKPGANMPGHAFRTDDMQALVAYLESLK